MDSISRKKSEAKVIEWQLQIIHVHCVQNGVFRRILSSPVSTLSSNYSIFPQEFYKGFSE